MHSRELRAAALLLLGSGAPLRSVSRQLGVARSTLRSWASNSDQSGAGVDLRCFRCIGAPCPNPVEYEYLLGQFLGDGYLVTSTRVPKLRIASCDAYPGIAAEVDAAILATTSRAPGFVQSTGCSDRYSYWMHWPCLLPQHGPSRKRERPIVLEPWQRELVDADPWPLIRGLIHSDGRRAVNRVTVRGKQYEYPRYFFSNVSADILGIFTAALDRVGVKWRLNRTDSVSIARRDSVYLMDEHVGPKH